ncbi:hypothetical protein VIBNIWn13_930004 [Vibrio nigripulchritudo Wn13]|nr:hypothetical protein VIBNIENn2_150004 [Vibrio nigripulchritudo ENn2]CCO40248.1 hypothetical protein VIBNISFn135_310004 [Vibrio nigripulchritudo SFn135]CCO55878.1 hypothetical protein VIBNIWn13_930004 [Vibrio nigripulchritudo Wn13]
MSRNDCPYNEYTGNGTEDTLISVHTRSHNESKCKREGKQQDQREVIWIPKYRLKASADGDSRSLYQTNSSEFVRDSYKSDQSTGNTEKANSQFEVIGLSKDP